MGFWQTILAGLRCSLRAIWQHAWLFAGILVVSFLIDQTLGDFLPLTGAAGPPADVSALVVTLFRICISALLMAASMSVVYATVLGDGFRLSGWLRLAILIATIEFVSNLPLILSLILKGPSGWLFEANFWDSVVLVGILIRLILVLPTITVMLPQPLRAGWQIARGHWWFSFGVLVFGLFSISIAGVFIAAILYRLTPDSARPYLADQLGIQDFVPVFGWLFWVFSPAFVAGLSSQLYRKYAGVAVAGIAYEIASTAPDKPKISTSGVIGAAWNGAIEAINNNRILFFVTWVAGGLGLLVMQLLHPALPIWYSRYHTQPMPVAWQWYATESGIIQGALLTFVYSPALLSTYQFVLLQVTGKVFGDMRRFVAFFLCVGVWNLLPLLLNLLLPFWSNAFLLIFLVYAFMFRLILVFPAIVLDVPSPIRDSWRRSKGRWWQMLGVIIVGSIPFGIVVSIATYMFLPSSHGESQLGVVNWVGFVVLVTIETVVWPTFNAALASGLFKLYGGLAPIEAKV